MRLFQTLFIACAVATLATAQDVGKQPISAVLAGGLTTAEGAKILLIRAAGDNCRDSVLIPVNPSDTSPDEYYSGTERGGRLSRLPVFSKIGQKGAPVMYRTAIQVKEGCWCSDPDAGLAVMAPGKGVSYRSNQESMRRPTQAERAVSTANVKVFGLCTASEIRIDMRPRREVPVTVWVSDKGARSMAKDDLANLDWILDKELAGITVRPDYHLLKDPLSLNHELPACYPNRDQSACCESVRRSRAFDPGALNLYYGAGSGNFTCPDVPASFVHDAPILGDAAHELSHALGLNQSDHLETYASGHTRGHAAFNWSNVMWDRTQFLKNKLSASQAFWMSQTCRSWFGLNASCLNCTEKAGTDSPSSPCPSLSVGAEGPPSPPGEPCSGLAPCDVRKPPENALLFVPARRNKKPVENCEVPLSIYKDGRSLETQLKERYNELKKHVRGRRDLELGSLTTWDFLDRWEHSFAFNIAPLSPEDRWFREFQEKNALPHALYLGDRSALAAKPLPVCAAPSSTPE